MQIDALEPQGAQLQPIKDYLGVPELWINLSALGASTRDMHRRDIRRSLIEFLTQCLKERSFGDQEDMTKALSELVQISNTASPPQTSFASISIAHCPLIGGFAVTPSAVQVGFDIEAVERVNPTVVQRISSTEEFFDAPDSASLWVAKESAFKSMRGPNQPEVISVMQILSWQQISENLHSFQFSAKDSSGLSTQGRGVVIASDRLKMGLAII